MSLIVHSDLSHSPRYWITSNNETVYESENGAETVQWAVNRTNRVFLSGSISIDCDNVLYLQGATIRGDISKKWYRICSRCNGIIFKGEGQIIGKCKTDGCTFWHHKKYGLCQKFIYGE